MHSIGNERDARTIQSWVRSSPKPYGLPQCVKYGEAPEGWEFIGRGSYRSVWRSPEGVAYKVGHDGANCQSSEEVGNLKFAWERGAPEGCRLPKFSAYYPEGETVVAIELIEGATLYDYPGDTSPDGLMSYYDLLHRIESRFRLRDMHSDNAIVDQDGLLVPIDFGD